MWLPESRSLIIAYILTLVALFCFISFLMNALNLRTFCFQIYFMRNRIQFYLNDRKTFNVWILNIYFLLSRCVLFCWFRFGFSSAFFFFCSIVEFLTISLRDKGNKNIGLWIVWIFRFDPFLFHFMTTMTKLFRQHQWIN